MSTLIVLIVVAPTLGSDHLLYLELLVVLLALSQHPLDILVPIVRSLFLSFTARLLGVLVQVVGVYFVG